MSWAFLLLMLVLLMGLGLLVVGLIVAGVYFATRRDPRDEED